MRTVPRTVRTMPLASRAGKAEPEYDAVDAKSRVGRLLRSCRLISVLLRCDGVMLHCDHVGVTTVAGYVRMFLHTLRAQSQYVSTVYTLQARQLLLFVEGNFLC